MGVFGWRILALPYSLDELMTGDPKIRFPKATQPDNDGWWPAAQCDSPGGLGDVSALPSLKDAGITHPPSAKMPRPKVSVLKDDQVELVDAPPAPRMPTPAVSVAGSTAVEMTHPPMKVTPESPTAQVPNTPSAASTAKPVDDPTGAVKVAFTKEESEAILRKPAEEDPKSEGSLGGEGAQKLEALSTVAVASPAMGAVAEPSAAHAVNATGLAAGATAVDGVSGEPLNEKPVKPPKEKGAALSKETPAEPLKATSVEPTQEATSARTSAEAPAPVDEPEAPTRMPEPETPLRPAKRPEPEPEPEFVFNPKTMPISPPAPSIPSDDTDSLIVESFTESVDDDDVYVSAFSDAPPDQGGMPWGRAAKERRRAKRYQQAIDRNLANTHAPLDVLFAQERGAKPRRMALRPSFGRDLLVWFIAFIGVGQMLYRGWEILPTLNTFNDNISDFQILAAISLMVGGAVSGVLALIAVRFITGMRSAFAWILSVLFVFGVFPWYGFGSQLSPTGLPPLPKPIDVVFNPVFDQNGLLGITLIGLAICALVAMISAFMVGPSKQS